MIAISAFGAPRPASTVLPSGSTRTTSKLGSAGAARCGTSLPGASALPGASPAASAFGDCSPDSVAAPPDGRTPAGGPLADGSPAGGTLADGALADCGAGVPTVGTPRSEARRVGEEGVQTGGAWCAPCH